MLTIHSIASADPPKRPGAEQPEQRPDMRGEAGENGVRHGTPPMAVPSTPVQSDESLPPVNCHPTVIVSAPPATHDGIVSNHHTRVNSSDVVAFTERQATEIGCGESLLPPPHAEQSVCGNMGITYGKTVDASGIGCSAPIGSSAAGIDRADTAPTTACVGISAGDDRTSGDAAAAERVHLIPCPMCAGSGRGHVRACSLCRGECGLRIAIAPDDTGIAPNWARYQAVLAEEYDGAATGRAGAVGCGQTPKAAIEDLIERLEQ